MRDAMTTCKKGKRQITFYNESQYLFWFGMFCSYIYKLGNFTHPRKQEHDWNYPKHFQMVKLQSLSYLKMTSHATAGCPEPLEV